MDLPIVGTGDHVWEVRRPFGPSLSCPEPDNVSHVAVDSQDRVYLYRRGDPPVVVTDPDGSVIDTWGSGLLLDAHGIFISADDTVYLVDRDAHEVLAFDRDGEVKMRLGNRGRPALQAPFNHPADIAVSPITGEIYVSDGYGNSADPPVRAGRTAPGYVGRTRRRAGDVHDAARRVGGLEGPRGRD